MNPSHGLQTANNCGKCRLRKPGYFCSFDSETLRELSARSISRSYPQHAVLVAEGHPAHGVFVVCQGRVKLTSMSKDGRFVILRIAQAGEVVGLNAVMSNGFYECTAKTLIPTQVRFVGAVEILRIIRAHPDAAIRVAQSLSRDCNSAYHEIRSLALAPTRASRLATLLLSWCTPSIIKGGEPRIDSEFTQEEIAEMIGTSRETVSRLLTKFKKRRMIEPKGAGYCVTDVEALEGMAI